MTSEATIRLIRQAYEKNFTKLDLSSNELTYLPLEIEMLTNLTELDVSINQLTQLPPGIENLQNL